MCRTPPYLGYYLGYALAELFKLRQHTPFPETKEAHFLIKEVGLLRIVLTAP